jgi:hypothetical protein
MRVRLAGCVFFGLLGLSLVRGDDSAPADPNEALYQFATGAQEENGRLRVSQYEFSKTWINGVRQRDDEYDFVLKPGDVVDSFVCECTTEVVQYRLESVSPKQAVFTVWRFAAVRTLLDKNRVRYGKGRQVSKKTFVLDLTKPNGELVDYGPNDVEMGDGAPARSKSLR